MSAKTFRVITRVVSEIIYEIDCEDEAEARCNYSEGTVVKDECLYDDIEAVVQIDVAEVKP